MSSAHGRAPRAFTALSRLSAAAIPPVLQSFRHFPDADLGRPASQPNSGWTQSRIPPQLVCRCDLCGPGSGGTRRQTLTALAAPALITELSNSS